MDADDLRIINAVRVLSSDKRLGKPIIAWDVFQFADEFNVWCVEGTIRRRMSRLADEGRLIRVGGLDGTRRGYVLPDWRAQAKRLPDVVQMPDIADIVRYQVERRVG